MFISPCVQRAQTSSLHPSEDSRRAVDISRGPASDLSRSSATILRRYRVVARHAEKNARSREYFISLHRQLIRTRRTSPTTNLPCEIVHRTTRSSNRIDIRNSPARPYRQSSHRPPSMPARSNSYTVVSSALSDGSPRNCISLSGGPADIPAPYRGRLYGTCVRQPARGAIFIASVAICSGQAIRCGLARPIRCSARGNTRIKRVGASLI